MFLGLLLLTSVAAFTNDTAAAEQITVESCDFGETYAFSRPGCDVAVANAGDKAVRIGPITSDSPADEIDPSSVTIAPHMTTYVHVDVNVDNASGYLRRTLHFPLDSTTERRAQVKGFVLSALDDPDAKLDFGVVDLNLPVPEKALMLSSHEADDFRIERIIEAPSWISASVEPDGATLRARIRADSQWGVFDDVIKVAIRTPQQSVAWISVHADIRGKLVPSLNPVELGVMRRSEQSETRIVISSRDGRAFELGKVELRDLFGSARISHCMPDRDGCRWIELTLKDQPLGIIKGSLFVEVPEWHTAIHIPVRGMMVKSDFRVRTLSDAEVAKASASSAHESMAPRPVDVKQSIEHVMQPAEAGAAPPGKGPLLKWSISNGRLIYGFQIFRASAANGPYVLQNHPVLRNTSSDDSPTSFQWRDNTATSGQTYWYYIGVVNYDGAKHQLTQPQKTVAK